MKSIAVIGASSNRDKFGNKCIRAFLSKGFIVYPINPKENEIEGLKNYRTISEIEDEINIVSIYLRPEITLNIVDEIIAKKPSLVYLNPGTESEEIKNRFEKEGIEVKEKCSIVAIGINPSEL